MIYIIKDCMRFTFEEMMKSFRLDELESARILSSKRSCQSISARYACAYAIKKEYGKKDMTFSAYDNGKPYCVGQKFCISLSHSGRFSLAGTSSSPIGADVEKIRKYNEKACEKYFTSSEKDFLSSNENKDIAYTAILSLKESLAKLSGDGLSKTLHTTSLSFKNGEIFCNEKSHLHFVHDVIDGYVVSGCCEKKEDLKIIFL